MYRSYASCNHSTHSTAQSSASAYSSAWQDRPGSVPSFEDFESAPVQSAFSIVKQVLHVQESVLEELFQGRQFPLSGLRHLLGCLPKGEGRSSYDLDSITKRRQLLKSASLYDETGDLLGFFRCLVTRNIGGISNPYVEAPDALDRKHTFNRYNRTVLQTTAHINELFDTSEDREKRIRIFECVCDTIAEFGRSATLLSGGGTLGMTHIGVLETLRKTNPKLISQVISGASAGSIVAAVFASKRDEDLDDAVERLCHGDLDVFVGADEQDQSYLSRSFNALKRRSWYDPKNLERVMKDLLGEKLTFRDAFNLTGKRLNITVSTSDAEKDGFLLLNYINSPDVVIWSAVVASCAVPVAFPAGQLYFRDIDLTLKRVDTPVGHTDGSLYGDVPMDRMSREFNVNYFVVSQVNPHVVPFLNTDKTAQRSFSYPLLPWGKNMLRSAIVSALDPLKDRTVLGRPVFGAIHSIFHQRYEGDLTIFPVRLGRNWVDMAQCLFNPTHEFMDRAVENGEQEAERMLPKAHAVLDVEMMLQDLKIQLKTKLKFSKSEEDLHRKEIEYRMQSGRSYNALSRRGGGQHVSTRSVTLPSASRVSARAHRTSHSLELGYMQLNMSAEKVAGSIYDSESASSTTESGDEEQSGDEEEEEEEEEEEDTGLRIAMPPRGLQRFTSNPPSPIDTRRRNYFPPSRSSSRSTSRSSSPAGPTASMSSLRMTPRTPSPEQRRKFSGSSSARKETQSTRDRGRMSAFRRKLPKTLRNLIDMQSGINSSIESSKPGREFNRKRSLSAGGLGDWVPALLRREEREPSERRE